VRAREPGHRLRLAAGAERLGLEAENTKARGAFFSPAEFPGLLPLRIGQPAGDDEDGSDVLLHELQRRVETVVEPSREHDDRVGVGRRRVVGGWPDEENGNGHEPEPDEHDERDKEAAHGGTTVPSRPVSGVGVLFTCAGQRVDIITSFRRAGARTLAVDVNPLAPALYHADEHAFVPRVDDPAYVQALAGLVASRDLSLIVPLTDLDHSVLSRARGELGALVLLPSPEIVDALADKWLAHELFVERGIGSPATWLPVDIPGDVEYPVLVKARRGFGSRNIFHCRDRRELDFFLGYTSVDSMVQACCRGEEFSIDVFCDLEGRCLNAVPRTMIESKGGESIKGMTISDDRLIEVGRHVAETLRLVGPANIQCFREPDGTHVITDINPRFGGGFPLPTAAGSRYPEIALALAVGERPEPTLGDFRAGLYMTRFFSELVLIAGDDDSLEPFAEELPEPVAEP
jgi:carbamoyl-phosphate synthase large subunit